MFFYIRAFIVQFDRKNKTNCEVEEATIKGLLPELVKNPHTHAHAHTQTNPKREIQAQVSSCYQPVRCCDIEKVATQGLIV